MDAQPADEFSWESLCDVCAGILRIEVVDANPPYAYAVVCDVHGLVGLMVRKRRH